VVAGQLVPPDWRPATWKEFQDALELIRIASREDADEAFPHSLVQAPREFRFRTRPQSFFKPAQWGKSGVRRVQFAKNGLNP
jgi:hypothetical protein